MLKQVLLIYYNFEYNVSYMKNEELFSEHTYIFFCRIIYFFFLLDRKILGSLQIR